MWASKMTKQIKVLAAKSDHLNSIFGTHMVDKEKLLPRVVL